MCRHEDLLNVYFQRKKASQATIINTLKVCINQKKLKREMAIHLSVSFQLLTSSFTETPIIRQCRN